MFDSCYLTIQDSMNVMDFYALTSYVIAGIEDGHTNCRLPRTLLKDYISRVKVFPAMVMFIHNRGYIFCCNQNIELSESELLSINNVPMHDIINKLFDYISSDGKAQSRKNWEMADNFQLLYNLVFGERDSFNITFKTNSGEAKSTILRADLFKNMLCPSPFPKPTSYLNLSYTADNIAVLTIKTFFNGYLKQTGENFKSFLDSSFNDLAKKNIVKLLIDLRGNQGGNDNNGQILYSYLTQQPFSYYSAQESVSEKYTVNGHSELALQYPSAHNYSGKAYFLTDGRSFSATAEFSAVAKSNKRGIFIGEETGGGYYGNTSGDDDMVTLPNTEITCRIPLVKYSLAVKKALYPDRGVMPDYPYYPSITDIVENRDEQLAYALKTVLEH
jgi:hypothetical protein